MLVVGTGPEANPGAGSAPPLQDPLGQADTWAFCSTIIKNFKTLTAECEPSAGAPAGKLAPGVSEYRSENAVMK